MVMDMVERKTTELEGAALDWSVAIAEGWTPDRPKDGQLRKEWLGGVTHYIAVGEHAQCASWQRFSPSTDWSQGGPLIVKYGCDLTCIASANCWEAACWDNDMPVPDLHVREGETPLIAACRSIVAAKLGDTVQIPSELA